MAIFDILIYVAFAFFASSLAKKSEKYIEDNDIAPTHWDKYLTYFVLFFTMIGGIRWMVGSDFASYATIFSYRKINFESNEKLWNGIVYVFQSLNIHWTFGLAFCTFIQMYFVTKALQQYRWLLVFMPFVFFGGIHWLNWTGAVRQMIVGCAFFWASRFISEKKMIKYLVFIGISSLVHQSALILLPFYLTPKWFDIVNKRWTLILILLGCVVLGQVAAFSGLSGFVQSIANATDYEAYGEGMSDKLLSNYDNEALKFGPMMLTYLLIPIFIIWYGPELKEMFFEKIPYFNLWYNLSYLFSCSYFLVCNLGHIFIRPTLYFSVFQLVMASLLLYHLCTEYKKFGIRQYTTYLFCFIVALNTSWDVYKASNSGRVFEPTTYKVFFLHNDQRKWFNL